MNAKASTIASRALFEREGARGADGPHNLDRSFSGTYSERGDRDD